MMMKIVTTVIVPMYVTLVGIVTLLKDVHPAKALSLMDV